MTENKDDKDKVGIQEMVDLHNFCQWCENIFDINKRMHEECCLDRHHCRWFFIGLFELMDSGLRYATDNSEHCELLQVSKNHIKDILSLFTEDEFFMLQYYRHCASHIFQHNYGYCDSNGTLKTTDRKHNFYLKSHDKLQLTQDEVREKAKSIIGKYGLGEDIFKHNIVSRCYQPLLDWEDEYLAEINKLTNI